MWPTKPDPTKDFIFYVRTFEMLVKRCQSGVVGCWRERMPQKSVSATRTQNNKVPILTPQYFMICPFVAGVYPPKLMTDLARAQMQIAGNVVTYDDRPSNSSELVHSILSTIVAEDATDEEE